MIDSEKLIEEVKKRPPLYDGKTYHPSTRKILWEEIAKDVYHDVWDTASASEKEAMAKEIQTKWKTLRDTYTRIKKQEREDQMKGIMKIRKKHVLFDQLLFLDPVVKSTTNLNIDPLQLNPNECKNEDSADNNTSESFTMFKVDQEIFEANTSAASAGEAPEDKLTNILKELLKIQKDEKADDRMGNKKFLLSLLPFMEKLPDDVNLEVRLQLMSIIQTYSNGESFLKP